MKIFIISLVFLVSGCTVVIGSDNSVTGVQIPESTEIRDGN